MVSKSQIKLITSLSQKKYRRKNGLFAAEGKKTVSELLASDLELSILFTEEDIFEAPAEKIQLLERGELKKISFLKTPQTCVALFKIPKFSKPLSEGLILALDGVSDPGNLGTIIRLCDWFGVQQIVCSENTADCYNPKVIQATMGSISRVRLAYLDLPSYMVEIAEKQLPVFGGFMDGRNVYGQDLPKDAVLVMGNEANGISEEIAGLITRKIAIPQMGEAQETESLNVSTATAILLSEFRRALFTGK